MEISFTTVLAGYGAVVSTIALSWSVFRDITDRGKLKVHCFLATVVQGGQIYEHKYLTYQVTNVGRRPTMVTSVGGRRKPQPNDDWPAFFIRPEKLPKMLQPGEYVMESSPDFKMLATATGFSATDSHGRTYWARRSEVKLIRKQLTELLKSGA